MATLIFDMSNPEEKKLIDGWADNTEYECNVKLKTGVGEQRNVCAVSSVESTDVPEDMPEEAAPPATAKKAKEPSMKVEY